MKKVLIVPIILILGVFIYSTFFYKLYTKNIKIYGNTPYLQDVLNQPKKVALWQVPFNVMDSTQVRYTNNDSVYTINRKNSLKILPVNTLSYIYNIKIDNKEKEFIYTIFKDSPSVYSITLGYKNNLIGELFNNNTLVNNAKESLKNLEDLFIDTKKMYGYTITMAMVEDTSCLYKSATVANTNKKVAINNMYNELEMCAKKLNASYNGTKMYYQQPYGNDSTTVYLGIVINNANTTYYMQDGISMKHMPYKKNLIMGYYQGAFNEMQKCFLAMLEFKTNNQLVSMALPFAKFTTNGINFDENQIIQCNLYYPIF